MGCVPTKHPLVGYRTHRQDQNLRGDKAPGLPTVKHLLTMSGGETNAIESLLTGACNTASHCRVDNKRPLRNCNRARVGGSVLG